MRSLNIIFVDIAINLILQAGVRLDICHLFAHVVLLLVEEAKSRVEQRSILVIRLVYTGASAP